MSYSHHANKSVNKSINKYLEETVLPAFFRISICFLCFQTNRISLFHCEIKCQPLQFSHQKYSQNLTFFYRMDQSSGEMLCGDLEYPIPQSVIPKSQHSQTGPSHTIAFNFDFVNAASSLKKQKHKKLLSLSEHKRKKYFKTFFPIFMLQQHNILHSDILTLSPSNHSLVVMRD